MSADAVVWKDVTSVSQSLAVDNDALVNRNVSRTRYCQITQSYFFIMEFLNCFLCFVFL